MQSSRMTDEWLEEHLISPDDEGIEKDPLKGWIGRNRFITNENV